MKNYDVKNTITYNFPSVEIKLVFYHKNWYFVFLGAPESILRQFYDLDYGPWGLVNTSPFYKFRIFYKSFSKSWSPYIVHIGKNGLVFSSEIC